MKTAFHKIRSEFQLLGIFWGVAVLMSAHELLKALLFEETLTPWKSHSITVIVTVTLAAIAQSLLGRWTVRVNEQLQIAATAFETQEGMMVTDANGTILRVNHAFTRITGYTQDDVVGNNPRLLQSNQQDANFYSHMWETIKETGEWKGELWSRRKNGEIFPEYLNISAVKGENGIISNYVAMLTDITERKNAEMQSAALLQRNQALMNNAFEGIHILDEHGRIIEANDAFCRHLNYTQEEVLQLSLFDFEAKFSAEELKENIHNLLNSHATFESVHRRKDGTLVDVELSISGVELAGKRYLFALCRDITDRKKAEEKIRQLAFYDPLTGLANRRLMTDRMEHALAHARRTGELLGICMIDLDGFKQVNDQMGHKAGDQLLIEVAKRLQDCIRQSDTVSRLGGDEFSLILSGFKKISECELSLKRIITTLAAPYFIDGDPAHVTASIGVTIFPNDGGSADLLLRHADQAMYEAKQAGKNCYHLFNPSHQNQQQANKTTLRKIEKALSAGQIVLYYQPQVDCRLGKVTGVEALIRWHHPILGVLAPSEFIPLLEQDNLIISVGEWVIQEALKQLTEWRAAGIDLTIGVNISARHLHQSDFVARLNSLISDYPKEIVSRLSIEILETTALENVSAVAEAMQQCRQLGIHVALDDFGTGYSSLTHLKQLPADILKIDQNFIFGMLHNPDDLAIVSSIIGLASAFKREVVAEGVESIEQVLMLLELGCDHMQGFCLARPMPANRIPSWVSKFEPDPLWKLSGSQHPTRDYFELLLAEATHRHWIQKQLEKLSNIPEEVNAELLLDHRQCRFGQWHDTEGQRKFGSKDWFHSIDPLHRRIHETAARLYLNKRNNNKVAIEIDEASLTAQQGELDLMLKNLRSKLAENYLTLNLTQGIKP